MSYLKVCIERRRVGIFWELSGSFGCCVETPRPPVVVSWCRYGAGILWIAFAERLLP